MTVRLEYAGFAEGVATDIRGGLILVGFNTPLMVLDTLPSQVSPVFAVVAADETDDGSPAVFIAGKSFGTRLSVQGPDGETLFFTESPAVVPRKRHPKVATRLHLIAQLPIPASKVGSYVFRAVVGRPGDGSWNDPLLVADAKLYVTDADTYHADLASAPPAED